MIETMKHDLDSAQVAINNQQVKSDEDKRSVELKVVKFKLFWHLFKLLYLLDIRISKKT